MNICVVNPNRQAYSETFVRNHIEHLPGNVYYLYGSWYPAFDSDDQRIADHYIRRNWSSRLIAFLCKLLPAFIANRLPSFMKGYPFDEKLNQVAFRHYLQSKKIDVVLAEFILKGVVVKDVCAELRIPFVVHTHGGGDIRNKICREYFSAYPDLFQKASRIIAVDSFSAAKLLELGLEETKLVQLRYGINTGLFAPAQPSQNEPIFFAVGRFVDKKAPHLTILAFSEAVKKHPYAKLVMGGCGDLLEACRQLVKALRIEDNVSFPGILPPSEVALMMQKSRAFLQHSVHTADGESEGTPVVILEAMSCGLPVVSTRHNGIADTIVHGEDGLLMEENDVQAMAGFIIKLIEDPELADRLGAKARRKVETNFAMANVIGRLYKLLEDVVAERRDRLGEAHLKELFVSAMTRPLKS